MHHAFFACWSVRQQYCFSYRLVVKKSGQLPIVYDKKTNSWNRTLAHTVVGQNSRKAMMWRRRTLSSVMKIHVIAQRPLIRQHSLLLQKHTKKKRKKPTLGLKKLVSKVRNPIQFFCISVLKTYTGQVEGVGRLQSLIFLSTFLMQRYFQNQKQISRILKGSIDWVKLPPFLFGINLLIVD